MTAALGAIFGFLLAAPAKVAEAVRLVRSARRTRTRERILRSMLEDPKFGWRRLDTLAKAVALPEADTRELLIGLGARASTTSGAEVWGLTSRHGSSGVAAD